MTTYVALLRGVNVGGKTMIKMAELQAALAETGLENVRTYIQSGNVLFESKESDTAKLGKLVEATIEKQFKLPVAVAVFSHAEWTAIIKAAPKWWGHHEGWKHNLLVMIKPYDETELRAALEGIKPDIEAVAFGEGVVYQSLSIKLFGRATTGKLASMPIYKKMTIRNYNTSTKLLTLLES